jgi:hypothetical protein
MSVNYLKDTEAFWRERQKARENLDNKRRAASFQEKLVIAEKLRVDMALLKNARAIKSKPVPKQSKI